jgi:hypothetical protein
MVSFHCLHAFRCTSILDLIPPLSRVLLQYTSLHPSDSLRQLNNLQNANTSTLFCVVFRRHGIGHEFLESLTLKPMLTREPGSGKIDDEMPPVQIEPEANVRPISGWHQAGKVTTTSTRLRIL